MYRDNVINSRNLTKREFRKTELHKVCRVDQFQAKEFNKNEFGWASNSLSAMVKATSYLQFMAIAQQVSQRPAQFNLPKGATVKDAIALCRPRMAQSPAELDLWAQQLASRDMEKLNDAYEKSLKNQFDKIHEDSASASAETSSESVSK